MLHAHHDIPRVQTAEIEAGSTLRSVYCVDETFIRSVMIARKYLEHDMPLSHCLGDRHWPPRACTRPKMGLSHCVIAHPRDGCVTPSCPPDRVPEQLSYKVCSVKIN